MISPKNKVFGFTLIEMLVVIGVLALISSIVIVAIDSSKTRARDARRKADIKQIQQALEMFYNAYGRYPAHRPAGFGCFAGSDNNWASSRCNGDQWLTIDPDFYKMMVRLPKDPLEKGNWPTLGGYMYAYRSQNTLGWGGPNDKAQYYDLAARLENSNDTDRCDIKCWRSYSSNSGSYCAGEGGKCGAGWPGDPGQVYAGR